MYFSISMEISAEKRRDAWNRFQAEYSLVLPAVIVRGIQDFDQSLSSVSVIVETKTRSELEHILAPWRDMGIIRVIRMSSIDYAINVQTGRPGQRLSAFAEAIKQERGKKTG